jgi:hypothetical protein
MSFHRRLSDISVTGELWSCLDRHSDLVVHSARKHGVGGDGYTSPPGLQ